MFPVYLLSSSQLMTSIFRNTRWNFLNYNWRKWIENIKTLRIWTSQFTLLPAPFKALATFLHHWGLFDCLFEVSVSELCVFHHLADIQHIKGHQHCVKLHWSNAACRSMQSTQSSVRLESRGTHSPQAFKGTTKTELESL